MISSVKVNCHCEDPGLVEDPGSTGDPGAEAIRLARRVLLLRIEGSSSLHRIAAPCGLAMTCQRHERDGYKRNVNQDMPMNQALECIFNSLTDWVIYYSISFSAVGGRTLKSHRKESP